jgi:predicted RNA-binding protein
MNIDGKEEVLLEGVELLENRDGEVKVVSLFGEEKIVKGRIASLSLLDHKIVIEPI